MNKKNSLVHKFLEYAIGSGLALILGLISSPIITRLIKPEEFGKFSMFNIFTGIMGVLVTVGLDQAFVRFFYEEEENNKALLLRKTIKLPIIVCLISIFIIFLIQKPLSMYLFEQYDSIAVMLVMGNLFIMLFNRYALLTIRMKQNGKFYSFIQVLQKFIYILFVVGLFLLQGSSYIVLLSATIISNLIVTIIAIIPYKKFWSYKVKDSDKLKSTRKDIISYGLPLMFTLLISWSFQSADKLFLKQYSDYAQVGIYAAAFSIIALLNQVQGTFLNFWVPVAYEHYEEKKEDKNFFIKVFEIVTIAMFILSIFLILFKDVIVLLLGPQYREASMIMPFLVFMPLMNTISEVTVVGIGFMKKTKYHIYITVTCAVFNIICNFALVPILGAKGAAITTGITYILFFIIRTAISQRLYHVGYNLKKFYALTTILFTISIYATFNFVDIITVIMCIMFIICIFIFYRQVFKELYVLVIGKLNSKKKKDNL